jgi:leucyl/phenylalanyl-tRNA--protein transferase
MIPWLTSESLFPPLHTALTAPNGLLAVGGDLSPQRLIEAYRSGIFPWFNSGEPVLWWSPDPRMVLFPGKIRISKSLR